MSSLEEIRTSIEARIADARREISSLETARSALRDGQVTVPQATRSRPGDTGKPTRAPKSRKAARQTKRQAPVSEPDASAVSASTGATPRVKAPRTPRRRPARARKSEVLAAGKLEAMLREAPEGLSAVAIATAANARASQVRELLDDRQAAGQVRRVGTGRGTRWRLVTDEERVVQRAAELEALATGAA